jgi:hypothetical protein
MSRHPQHLLVPAGGATSVDTVAAVRVDQRAVDRWLIVLAAVVGAVLRIAVLVSPIGRTDSDEAVVGLMARHIGRDGYPFFYWGQHYGGTIELAPIAVSQWLFGSSVIALRLPTMVLAVVSSVLVWRIGRLVLSPRGAVVAALITWLGPPAAVWFGVREALFYQPTVVIGLTLALVVLGARSHPARWRAPCAALLLGLGLWTSLYVVYFVVPVFVSSIPTAVRAIRKRHWPRPTTIVSIVVAFVVGTGPVLLDSAANGGAPFHISEAFPVVGTYWYRFGWFFTHGFPAGLGLRETFTFHWIGGPVGVVAYLAVLVLVGRGVWLGLRDLRWDAVGLAASPFVFACIAFGTEQPNLRYQFFVVPFVALVLVRSLDGRWRNTSAIIVALAVTLAITVIGLGRLIDISDNSGIYKVGHVGDLRPAERVLDAKGITDVFADYWVAYRITYDTNEHIIAAPTAGSDRYQPYHDRVRAASRSAWVVEPGTQLAAFTGALDSQQIAYEVLPAGDVVVVLPARPVMPESVPLAARSGTQL